MTGTYTGVERRNAWPDRIKPIHGAIVVLVGTFLAGISAAVFGLDAYRMPRQNAHNIAVHDSLPSHNGAEQRISLLESRIGALETKFDQSLCLQAADRDPLIAWESCLSTQQLRTFRRNE